MAHADEPLGLVVVDDDEREVALEAREHRAHGLDEIAVVERLEQVRNYLGIRLGAEAVASRLELGLELAVVLDDSVEHDRELAVVAAGERVGVLLVHHSVRGPAGVAEAGCRVRAVRAYGSLQVGEVADRADVGEPVILEQCDPGRVVPSKFEPLETCDEQILGRPLANVSDDSAHFGSSPLRDVSVTLPGRRIACMPDLVDVRPKG